jgi:hypothetical protein
LKNKKPSDLSNKLKIKPKKNMTSTELQQQIANVNTEQSIPITSKQQQHWIYGGRLPPRNLVCSSMELNSLRGRNEEKQ